MKNKIKNIKEIEQIANALHERNTSIVSTSGCFDILHAGHVTYLEEAKEQGDVLIVMLNSDISVKRLKGENRPIIPENERALVLSGLAAVDYVCVFEESTPCNAYKQFKPDIIVKGGDYQGKHIPEMDIVKEYGGVVRYASMVDGCSTTNIVLKIEKQVKGEGLI